MGDRFAYAGRERNMGVDEETRAQRFGMTGMEKL